MNKVQKYLKNVLIGVDQFFNSLTGGDPDETVSSRLGKYHRKDYGYKYYIITYPLWGFVNALFAPLSGWGHCEDSIEADEGSNGLFF